MSARSLLLLFLACLAAAANSQNDYHSKGKWEFIRTEGASPTNVRWRDSAPIDDTDDLSAYNSFKDPGTQVHYDPNGWRATYGIHSILAYSPTDGKAHVLAWGNNAISYFRQLVGDLNPLRLGFQYTPYLVWDFGVATDPPNYTKYNRSLYGSIRFLLDANPAPGVVNLFNNTTEPIPDYTGTRYTSRSYPDPFAPEHPDYANSRDSSNLFCAGHSQLYDGRILAAGGDFIEDHLPTISTSKYHGINRGFIYDPVTGESLGGITGIWKPD